jgi:hypothetical protein
MGETSSMHRILIGKPKGRMPLRRDHHRWEDNIKMDLKKKAWKIVTCIHLAQDRDWWWDLVNMVRTFRFYKGMGFLE